MIWIYLTGWMVATGYQLADEDFRIYDLIVCPLMWPACIVVQIMLFLMRRYAKVIAP